MTKFHFIVALLILLIGSHKVKPQSARFDSLIVSGIDQIYSIQFDEAKSTFEIVSIEYPTHPAGKFFSSMIFWWDIMLDLWSEEKDDQFYDMLEEVIDMCDEILDEDNTNVDAYFFKGGALGFRARLLAIRQDWVNAAMDGKDALPLVFDAYALDSTNVDVQLGFGIYHYYAAVIPEHYPFVKPVMIFFPDGDKENGLRQLEHAANFGKYSKVEASYFLMTSYYRYENNYLKAHEYADKLIKLYPDNPVFRRYKGRIFVKQGQYNNAKDIFLSVYNDCNKGKRGFTAFMKREASYYIGNSFYNNGIPDSSLAYFKECISISKEIDVDEESGFLINASLFVGKIYENMGMTGKARKIYNEIIEYRDYNGSEEKAEKALARLDESNPAK